MRIITLAFALLGVVACEQDTMIQPPPPRATLSRNLLVGTHISRGSMFAGVKWTDGELTALSVINHKYNEQIHALRDSSANPHGPIDPVTLGKLRVLRQKQLRQIRAMLSPANQSAFDNNMVANTALIAAIKARGGR